MRTSQLYIVGWQEIVRFPEFQNAKMRAKIDTGAASSAIHAEEYEEVRLKGTKDRPLNIHLRMKLKVGVQSEKFIWAQAPIVDYRSVKNSGGKIEERPFVETVIDLGDQHFKIILSVTNREKMKFPVLLGRSFLSGKFLVDSSSKKLMEPSKRAGHQPL